MICLDVTVPKNISLLTRTNYESVIFRETSYNVRKLVIPLRLRPLRAIRHGTLKGSLSEYSDNLIWGKTRNVSFETFLLISKRHVQQFLLIVFCRILVRRCHSLERSLLFFGGP